MKCLWMRWWGGQNWIWVIWRRSWPPQENGRNLPAEGGRVWPSRPLLAGSSFLWTLPECKMNRWLILCLNL
jgi:hypothetical protein